MKFAIASYGTRGDIEPCAAVGRELQRRGHTVRVAVPPNLIGLVESAGLTAVAYSQRDSQQQLDEEFLHKAWKIGNPIALAREAMKPVTDGFVELGATLKPLADGVDLLLTGPLYQEIAANVAEHYDIPVAALHAYPMRANGKIAFPARLPAPLVRSTMKTLDWLYWRMTRRVEDAQRRDLGLPKATRPAPQRMSERGCLEIQAYDELCFPGLAAEWDGRRPFVGALTLALAADTDNEVASWIAAGTPPIYFGFGSMPVGSPSGLVGLIGAACAELGERALICCGAAAGSGFSDFNHVKVVEVVNHAAVFPTCRAVVHHGGSGTTAAGLRAGVPALVLWITSDQPIWATQIKHLEVGLSRRFSNTTAKTLVADVAAILTPAYAIRARGIASEMTKPAESVASAADLLEKTARQGRFSDRLQCKARSLEHDPCSEATASRALMRCRFPAERSHDSDESPASASEADSLALKSGRRASNRCLSNCVGALVAN
jgi:UDP:flavonoid glycosyltransferase YjiC (YdhE family)